MCREFELHVLKQHSSKASLRAIIRRMIRKHVESSFLITKYLQDNKGCFFFLGLQHIILYAEQNFG